MKSVDTNSRSQSVASRSFLSRLKSRLRGLGGESGSAMIEVALIWSFLGLPLILGTAEIATVIYDSIEIDNASHAGSAYGGQSITYASNTSGITAAAQNEANDFGTALTVTPTTYYVCANNPTGTQYSGASAQSQATAACTGGSNHAVEFLQVVTSASVTPPFHLPGLATSFPIASTSVMEVVQ
jgi:hypothetical protein